MTSSEISVVAALIYNNRNEILITQRPAGSHLAGLWEFPGGKVEQGESHSEALRRELKEETNLDIKVDEHLWTERAGYPDKTVVIYFYRGVQLDGAQEVIPDDIADFRWVSVDMLSGFDFPVADAGMIKKLLDGFFRPD